MGPHPEPVALFNQTSSKRMRGLQRHGAKHCFERRTGVRWVLALARDLAVILCNLAAIKEHLPEYICF